MNKRLGYTLICIIVAVVHLYAAEKEIYRVGVYQAPPTIFVEDGEVQGIYRDILDIIAKREGITFEYVAQTWSENLAQLDAGGIDILTSIAYTEARDERFDFSKEVVITLWAEVYTQKSSDIRSLFDLAHKRIALLENDIFNTNFAALMGQFNIPYVAVEYEEYRDEVAALSRGEVDAAILGNLEGLRYSSEFNVRRSPIVFSPIALLFASKEGENAKLLNTIDRHLAAMKADDNSAYYQILEYWLSSIEPDTSFSWIIPLASVLAAVLLLSLIGIIGTRSRIRRTETLLRRKNEALADAEYLNIGLLESSPDPVIILATDGTIITANEHAIRSMGFRPGENILDFLADEQREKAAKDMEYILEHGFIQNREYTFTNESRTFTTDISSHLVYADDREPKALVLVMRDITERKGAHESLMGEHQLLEQILGENPAGILFLERDGSVVYKNKRLDEICAGEYERALKEQNAGQGHIFDLNDSPVAFEDLPHTKAIAIGQPVLNERMSIRRTDGSTAYISMSAVPMFDSAGNPVATVNTIIDISESIRAEQALTEYAQRLQKSNKDLEQFAYVASHDLQEPLRMVTNYVELLARRLDEHLDENTREYIAFAIEGAQRMKTLINDLLDYSRVGTRGRPFERAPVRETIDRATTVLALLIEETGAEIILDGALPVINADFSQMVQLFQNLIGNALKFRKDAPPRVHIQAKKRKSDYLFSVADNGIGIERSQIELIFDIFKRLHGRSEYEGTGIGLAVCKKIVERHGGRIWAESEPGKGTTFYFTIPKSLHTRPV